MRSRSQAAHGAIRATPDPVGTPIRGLDLHPDAESRRPRRHLGFHLGLHLGQPAILLVLLLGPLVGGCANSRSFWREATGAKITRPEEVPGALDAAEAALDRGDPREALLLLRESREVSGLDTAIRSRIDENLERAAGILIAQRDASGSDPEDLVEMLDLELPRQLAVTAAIQGAREYLAIDEPKEAFDAVREVERRYPLHYQRAAAAEILYEAGSKMVQDPVRFLGLFTHHEEGLAALEYMVLHYPAEQDCDQAYLTLARTYEADGLLGTALERHEELLTWHPESPLAVISEAARPRLRLEILSSPEYDRHGLELARRELEAWLERHPGHGFESRVRANYAACLQRLVESDLGVSQFYRRTRSGYGARLHADRAFETARVLGSESLIARCEEAISLADTIQDAEVRGLEGNVLPEPGLIEGIDHPTPQGSPR